MPKEEYPPTSKILETFELEMKTDEDHEDDGPVTTSWRIDRREAKRDELSIEKLRQVGTDETPQRKNVPVSEDILKKMATIVETFQELEAIHPFDVYDYYGRMTVFTFESGFYGWKNDFNQAEEYRVRNRKPSEEDQKKFDKIIAMVKEIVDKAVK